MGTLSLLQAAKIYWESLPEGYEGKRFYHISTDEVYGALQMLSLIHIFMMSLLLPILSNAVTASSENTTVELIESKGVVDVYKRQK